MSRKWLWLLLILLAAALYLSFDNRYLDVMETVGFDPRGAVVTEPIDEYAEPHEPSAITNLELPEGPAGHQTVTHTGYTLSYNEQHEQANWVAYELTTAEAAGTIKRRDNFQPDPLVITGSAHPEDYRRSGYDRGHLIPSADMKWSSDAMSECFLMSNMSPQLHAMNAGVWLKIEEKARYWVREAGALHIVAGPVLEEGLTTIGNNQVSVPKLFYKTFVNYNTQPPKAIAFLVPNADVGGELGNYAVTIDSVELLTGLDFYPALPDAVEQQLEQQLDLKAWGLRKSRR